MKELFFFQETPPILSSDKKNIHMLENIPSPISVLDATFCQDGLSPSLRSMSMSNSFQGKKFVCQTLLHTSIIIGFPSIQKPYCSMFVTGQTYLAVSRSNNHNDKQLIINATKCSSLSSNPAYREEPQ